MIIGVTASSILKSIGALPEVFAYFRFNSNSVEQVSGYANTANGVTYEAGLSGNAIRFTKPSNSNVTVVDDLAFTFADGSGDKPFYICGMFSFTSINADGHVFVNKRSNLTNSNEWSFDYIGGQLRVLVINPNGGFLRRVFSFTPTLGQKYWLACSYDGSKTAGGLSLFVDGAKVASTSSPSGTYTGMGNTSSPVVIGQGGYITSGVHDGTIEGLAFGSINLTDARALEIYNIQKTGGDLI